MPDFGDLVNKAKDLAAEHPDQVHGGLEKAEDVIEGKLGGQFGDQIEKTSDLVEGFLGIDKDKEEN